MARTMEIATSLSQMMMGNATLWSTRATRNMLQIMLHLLATGSSPCLAGDSPLPTRQMCLTPARNLPILLNFTTLMNNQGCTLKGRQQLLPTLN